MKRLRDIFLTPHIEQPAGLLSVLVDGAAEYGDRSDAAMDLSGYDQPEVEEALFHVILDPKEDNLLIDEAGHSLWVIWKRKSKWDTTMIEQMPPEARKFFDET